MTLVFIIFTIYLSTLVLKLLDLFRMLYDTYEG